MSILRRENAFPSFDRKHMFRIPKPIDWTKSPKIPINRISGKVGWRRRFALYAFPRKACVIPFIPFAASIRSFPETIGRERDGIDEWFLSRPKERRKLSFDIICVALGVLIISSLNEIGCVK